MPSRTEYQQVTSHDGQEFAAYVSFPEAGEGPGLLVFQEIFGINDNMRDLADRLADAGYIALVPDMFWRIEPRFERKDESGIGDAFAIVQKFDAEVGVADIQSAHAHLLGLPECSDKIGAVGFCLGGGLAFATAAHSRVDGKGPDAIVSYYGSAVNGMLGDVDKIECPMMFHYGAEDAFIPTELIDEVEAAVGGRDDVEFFRYPAGHAFSNNDAPSMYNQVAAAEAWLRTLHFFDKHLT